MTDKRSNYILLASKKLITATKVATKKILLALAIKHQMALSQNRGWIKNVDATRATTVSNSRKLTLHIGAHPTHLYLTQQTYTCILQQQSNGFLISTPAFICRVLSIYSHFSRNDFLNRMLLNLNFHYSIIWDMSSKCVSQFADTEIESAKEQFDDKSILGMLLRLCHSKQILTLMKQKYFLCTGRNYCTSKAR